MHNIGKIENIFTFTDSIQVGLDIDGSWWKTSLEILLSEMLEFIFLLCETCFFTITNVVHVL